MGGGGGGLLSIGGSLLGAALGGPVGAAIGGGLGGIASGQDPLTATLGAAGGYAGGQFLGPIIAGNTGAMFSQSAAGKLGGFLGKTAGNMTGNSFAPNGGRPNRASATPFASVQGATAVDVFKNNRERLARENATSEGADNQQQQAQAQRQPDGYQNLPDQRKPNMLSGNIFPKLDTEYGKGLLSPQERGLLSQVKEYDNLEQSFGPGLSRELVNPYADDKIYGDTSDTSNPLRWFNPTQTMTT